MINTPSDNSTAATLSPAEALAALHWWQEAGIEDTVGDTPADWFAFDSLPAPTPIRPATATAATQVITKAAPPPAYATQGNAELIASAKALADRCTTLEELREAIAGFEGCALKKLATNTVFADGNAASRLMLIGEAPDADEDREGIPFCGASGTLLDKMFAAIGRTRSAEAAEASFYVTNTVFWRPPGNRSPSTDELAICHPFVEKHIALVNPTHLVCIGGIAAQSLLGTTTGVTRLRGKAHEYKSPLLDSVIPTTVLLHPSNLLRQPSHKAFAWQDLLALKAKLEG